MEQLYVQISGGGPFGFRLYGGDDDPLVVAKLRKRSKAHDTGLQEGDILLGINGYTCQNMSHGVAMQLVDASTSQLNLNVLRHSVEAPHTCCHFCGVYKSWSRVRGGTTDPNAVHAAFQALGGQLRAPPASALTQGGGPPAPYQEAPSFAASQLQTSQQRGAVMNGTEGELPQSSYRKEHQTIREGDATHHFTTETKTEKFGGTTITKVRRQELTSFDPMVVSSGSSHSPMFSVSNVSNTQPAAKKPGVWSPSGSASKPASVSISAPSNVSVQQNPDQSFTLSIGFGGGDQKENISPHQQQTSIFKVSKVQSSQPKPGTWQPANVPAPVKSKPPEPQPMEVEEEEEPVYSHDPSQAPIWGGSQETQPMDQSGYPSGRPFHLQRILIEGAGSGSDEYYSGPDSPSFDGKTRKMDYFDPGPSKLLSMDAMERLAGPSKLLLDNKKLFGDSAFYDDPEHKYPTIEEQIKMARRVALSLTAPQNVQARGHRMFVKRQQRAEKWSTDHPGGPVDRDEDESDSEDKYYNPTPWQKPPSEHTWKPSGKPTPMPRSFYGDEPPKPPPLPSNLFSTPTVPVMKYNKNEDRTKAMSAEEIERMRLFEQKTLHNTVAPQICFSLADDLRNMKGKGGKLFAKRREKSKKWVVDEQDEGENERSGPDPDLIKKIGGVALPGMGMMPMLPPQKKKQDTEDGGVPVNRLKEMIDPPKPKMTPWDAAAEADGNVDKAFEHLISYRPYAAHPTGFQENLSKAAAQKAEPIVSGPAKMPEGTRKIQPWGSGSGGSGDSSFSNAATAGSSLAESDMIDSCDPAPSAAQDASRGTVGVASLASSWPSLRTGTDTSSSSSPSSSKPLPQMRGWGSASTTDKNSSPTSWDVSGGTLSQSLSTSTSMSSSATFDPSSRGGASLSGGFKPIKFKAPGMGGSAPPSTMGFNSGGGSANSTPWSASPAPSTGSYSGGFSGQAGVCDL